jgi:hypothetical protein
MVTGRAWCWLVKVTSHSRATSSRASVSLLFRGGGLFGVGGWGVGWVGWGGRGGCYKWILSPQIATATLDEVGDFHAIELSWCMGMS